MLYNLIKNKRDEWFALYDCPVKELVEYIIWRGQMRDAQIEAIKTFLFLKIACENRPLFELFSEGYFSMLSLDDLELSSNTRALLSVNAAARSLLEYSLQKDDKGKPIAPNLEKEIKRDVNSIDYVGVIKDLFYGVSYTDYLFSLPMGAGKTYLMAAFIYLELYFAINEPNNSSFARNFIIFAPSGLKSSVVPSLRTIKNFDPSWILPEPSASNLKRMLKFEVLDEQKSKNKSNRTKNPNAQKINNLQPLEDLIGLVAVTNAEKVILDRVDEDASKLFDEGEMRKVMQANELRSIIGKVPSLSVYIDEVHHAVKEEIKLRKVVTEWTKTSSFNSVIGFSGTPYLEKSEDITIGKKLKISSIELSNVVYYYPLIRGINNFLKTPIVRSTTDKDSLSIVDKGVRDFFERFGDKVYSNGTVAKLGIYCGKIENLENNIHPLVAGIVTQMGMNPNEVILKFHKGNKDFCISPQAEAEFASLDSPISKVRVVLLVQIGKEGWDCKSLTGIILSQQGDCPTNMVLQTSCRCLRQVDKGMKEEALIWLNSFNEEKLEAQLKQQQHISLQEFKNAINNKSVETINRYSRIDYLKLPPIEFYQLKVEYSTVITEDKVDTLGRIKHSFDNTQVNDLITTRKGFGEHDSVIEKDIKGLGRFISFSQWMYEIHKESFGTLPFDELCQYSSSLRAVYDSIMIGDCENLNYDHSAVRGNIRKAFCSNRTIETLEEIVPEEAKLLRIDNFETKQETTIPERFYPSKPKVEAIIDADNGKNNGLDSKTEEAIAVLESIGEKDMADKLKAEKLIDVSEKDVTFHYLPYRFDSDFEKRFFCEILKIKDFREKGLEIYYNGDRALTDFKIRCYKKQRNNWTSIGVYTPDFLIVKRIDGNISQAIIVETKGEGYAGDRKFNEKKEFMETFFCKQNNDKFGYNRFDYLYLEDSLDDTQRIVITIDAINSFFQDTTI